MSAAGGRAPLPEPGSIRCPRCSSPIGPEQDWCLECGAPARTRLAPTPNWRLPTVAIGAMIALAGALLAFSFVKLTGDDQTPAGATSPAVVDTSSTAGTTTPTPGSTTTAKIAPTAHATGATSTTPATTQSHTKKQATQTTRSSSTATARRTTSTPATSSHGKSKPATHTKATTTAQTTRDVIPAKVPTPP
jgi:hypothetical protein